MLGLIFLFVPTLRELSTLGHPLADLAWLASPWSAPGAILYEEDGSLPGGIPTEEAFVQEYANNRGWEAVDAKEWDFFRALNCYRRVGINHGVYARSVMGIAASDAVRRTGGTLQPFVDLGLSFSTGTYQSPLGHAQAKGARL